MKLLNILFVSFMFFSTTIFSQWEQVNFPQGYKPGLIVSLQGQLFVNGLATDSSGIFRSSNGGEEWIKCTDGLNPHHFGFYGNSLFPVNTSQGDFIFVGSDSGLYYSSNFGVNWQPRNNGIDKKPAVTFYYADGIMFTSVYQHNYRSSNYGESWNEITIGEVNNTASSFLKKDDFLLASILDNDGIPDDLFKSVDSGKTWISWGNNFGYCSIFISFGNSIYAGSGTVLQRSIDNGENWSYVPGLPSGYYFNGLKSIGDYLMAIHETGIYFQHKDSTAWHNISGNLLSGFIKCGELNDNYIYAITSDYITFEYKIWKRSYPDFITDIEENQFNPQEFTLEQNYPNPFNPSTKISWQSPIGSWQTIIVYDILGNEVATLVDEYKPAGSYEVEFQSSVSSHQLASGIYYYQLRIGDYIQTKKMLLIK